MLKHRILTALFLIPFVIWAILSAPVQGFTYGLAVVLFLATLEWNSFVAYKNKISGYIFSVVVTACFFIYRIFSTVTDRSIRNLYLINLVVSQFAITVYLSL